MSYLILFFTFLITTALHELGHVAGAKIARIRINTFSIGFGPVLIHTTYRNVTYQICLVLLGGYVLPTEVHATRTKHIIFVVSGLIMSIFIVPFFCLLTLQITDSTINFIDGLHQLIAPWATHPIRFFYDSVSILLTNDPYLFTTVIQLLAATSLFLGLMNCLPLIMLDGGQLLFLVFEKKFPSLREQELKLFKISYAILAILIATPMLIILIQQIKTTYPILFFLAFILYRIFKLTPELNFKIRK